MKLRVAVVLLLGIAIFGNCDAKRKSIGTYRTPAVCDSIVRHAVGDSIASILLNAGSVTACELKPEGDSITIVSKIKVVRNVKNIVKFSVTNPADFRVSDHAVYGKFLPQFQLDIKKGKANVFCQYDFGLRVWKILNADSEPICTLRINSNDCLRLAVRLFPDDIFLQDELRNSRRCLMVPPMPCEDVTENN